MTNTNNLNDISVTSSGIAAAANWSSYVARSDPSTAITRNPSSPPPMQRRTDEPGQPRKQHEDLSGRRAIGTDCQQVQAQGQAQLVGPISHADVALYGPRPEVAASRLHATSKNAGKPLIGVSLDAQKAKTLPHEIAYPLLLAVPRDLPPPIFEDFKDFKDPWAILGLSAQFPDEAVVRKATEDMRKMYKIDASIVELEASVLWHENHRKCIDEAGRFLNMLTNRSPSGIDYKDTIETAYARRQRFLNVAHEFTGRTLCHPPVGYGHSLSSRKCPAANCQACAQVDVGVQAVAYPEFSRAAERGAFCGLNAHDPVAAQRMVYVSLDMGRFVFRVSQYTMEYVKLPSSFDTSAALTRDDIIPTQEFPYLVCTERECKAIYETLRGKGSLPDQIRSWHRFRTKLHSREFAAMAAQYKQYALAVRLLRPVPVQFYSGDGRAPPPLLDVAPRRVLLGLGEESTSGQRSVLSATLSAVQRTPPTAEETLAMNFSDVRLAAPEQCGPSAVQVEAARSQTGALKRKRQQERAGQNTQPDECDSDEETQEIE